MSLYSLHSPLHDDAPPFTNVKTEMQKIRGRNESEIESWKLTKEDKTKKEEKPEKRKIEREERGIEKISLIEI